VIPAVVVTVADPLSVDTTTRAAAVETFVGMTSRVWASGLIAVISAVIVVVTQPDDGYALARIETFETIAV